MFLKLKFSASTSKGVWMASEILCQWRAFMALFDMSSKSGHMSLKSSMVFLRALKAGHSLRAFGSFRHLRVIGRKLCYYCFFFNLSSKSKHELYI